MPNLVFRFPAGRYHATPWGNHVNEGLVEWPPSPWRIVRALLATGFSKLGWREPPDAARELVEGLASTLPEYRLPRAVASHTRHFMPTDSKKPEDRTKIFDAFARLGKESEVAVIWPAALSGRASTLLAELLPKLSYLGRAESVVEARLVHDADLPGGDTASTYSAGRSELEPIGLLAPTTPSEYAAWLATAVAAAPAKATKKSTRVKRSPFPPDLVAALLADTAFLQEHGWTQPPGARRVLYYRPPLSTSPTRFAVRSTTVEAVDTALLALASDTRTREVLPQMSRALSEMEIIHRALLSRLGDAVCPELSGRNGDGVRLEGHRHALLAPLDLDRDGQLDHILVHAPMGLGPEAQRALQTIRRTYSSGTDRALFVTLAGLGKQADFARIGLQSIPELAEASVWTSRTPFVPPRHLKKTRHTLEDQVQAELRSRGLPPARRIDVLDRNTVIGRGFHRFVRARREPARRPAAPRFFALRIELESAARGPIALGYASHFGLGLFVPAG
jgi:CRISPR-associated protein Csb2